MILDRLIDLSESGSIHCQRDLSWGAFTATATKYVENDIKKLLGLDTANVYVTGFDRPNFIVLCYPHTEADGLRCPLCARARQ